MSLDEIATDRLLIGQGFNSAFGAPGGNSVQFDPAQSGSQLATASDSQGQKVRYTLKRITDLSELLESSSTAVSVSFGLGIFSADGSFNYAQSGHFSSYNEHLYVDVQVRNSAEVLKQSLLTDAALNYLERDDPSQFWGFAGDGYVYGRVTGGRFTAIVSFGSRSSDEQQSVRASVDAAVSLFGSGSADFSKAIQTLQSTTDLEVTFLRDGGIQAVPTLAGLVEAAQSFPPIVATSQKPVPVAMLLRDYGSVQNLPEGFPSNDALAAQNASLEAIAEQLQQGYLYKGDLLHAKLHPEQFEAYSPVDVASAWSQNEHNIRALLRQVDTVRRNPTAELPQPISPPSFRPVRLQATKPNTAPTHPASDRWSPIHTFGPGPTLLGRVPSGKAVVVELRGEWCRNFCLKDYVRPVSYQGADFGLSWNAHVQVRADDATTVLREIPWTGQPIRITDEGCFVFIPVAAQAIAAETLNPQNYCSLDTAEVSFTIVAT